MPTTHLVIYEITVAAGQEDAYRRWHDTHLAEVIRHVPGYRGVVRAEATDPKAFFAIYEVEGNPQTLDAELERAMGDGRVSHPPDGVLAGFKRTDLEVAHRISPA